MGVRFQRLRYFIVCCSVRAAFKIWFLSYLQLEGKKGISSSYAEIYSIRVIGALQLGGYEREKIDSHLFSPVCSIYSILSGILIGLAMMLASLATRGMVGMGDGILLTVTGVYLGGIGNLELLFMGLLLAACWSLVLIVGKKKKGKDQIAFVPFLLASYLTMLLRWQP